MTSSKTLTNSTFHPKIVVVGAGKVAGNLVWRLLEKGIPPVQIVNRTPDAARILSEKNGIAWTSDFSKIEKNADLVFVCVRDNAIAEVAGKLAAQKIGGLVVHTSGATSAEILKPFFARYGVFWPLQTFSPNKKPRWSRMPILLNANVLDDLKLLEKLARRLGAKPVGATDEQRARLHLAAVFANNFTNHCYAIAAEILKKSDLPFELLHPLMTETLEKALAQNPADAQTGPAVRGDSTTVERHLSMLTQHPDWQKLYAALSLSINPDLSISMR